LNSKEKNCAIDVSIIVPCYNEERTIPLLLQAILGQDYPVEKMEVVIADAQSEDHTRAAILNFSRNQPSLRVEVVDNIKRTIPAAINLAASNSAGKYLIRMDAHSVPASSYVSTCVRLLEEGIAQNVGGVWDIHPGDDSCVAKAIARAASHPVGAGDAKYRLNSTAGYADTVPFGAYLKETFMNLGGYNEAMLANEDYEFNARIRKSGGKIWLDPAIRSQYFARKTLRDLGRQYWRYGFWKYKMLQSFPTTIRWRQAIPPVFSLAVYLLGLLSIFTYFARIILGALLFFYFIVLVLFSIMETLKEKDICCLLMVPAFMIMHFSWGSGFLFSLINRNRKS
jgi:glycosyltransferase involved in cell wall biosynthesis